ncbi:hypothetical protein HMPREF9120_00191 [Neisseria sp. oral taxon 020 str. F0370]|nr:hypothetical protein HMPREF9120_00191 [Neisseria sp. oral taxon 020 str. F0370]
MPALFQAVRFSFFLLPQIPTTPCAAVRPSETDKPVFRRPFLPKGRLNLSFEAKTWNASRRHPGCRG